TLSVLDSISDDAFVDAIDQVISVTTIDNATNVFAILEHGGTAYLFPRAGSVIERYDFTQRDWLTPLSFPDVPDTATTAHVDEDGYYVAFGRALYRYSEDGTIRQHILSAPNVIQ